MALAIVAAAEARARHRVQMRRAFDERRPWRGGMANKRAQLIAHRAGVFRAVGHCARAQSLHELIQRARHAGIFEHDA
jgi:hypothetical protein